MNLYENDLYIEDLRYVAGLRLPWEKLRHKSLLLSGATGLIGSFLTDAIMEKNAADGLDCHIYALSRRPGQARERFSKHRGDGLLTFIPYDVNVYDPEPQLGSVDLVMHLASNTHPLQYSSDPIGTITANIIGLKNMLDLAAAHHAERFLFTSSVEVYGKNRGDTEFFDESYCGYIDSNTLRAGYPESKRCGEALCQAYQKQKGIDAVIVRLARAYGPTMLMSDSKAMSQFIKKGIAGEDIVLKSAGMQYFSYIYAADAAAGILTVLLKGEAGAAYNVADEASDIRLKDLAATIASMAGSKVVFELPDAAESAGYSTATVARMSGALINSLGWRAHYDIAGGISRTLRILSGEGQRSRLAQA